MKLFFSDLLYHPSKVRGSLATISFMLIMAASPTAVAANCKEIDSALATHYGDIIYYSNYNYVENKGDKWDQFDEATEKFYRAVGDYIFLNNISCSLPLAKKAGVNVNSSEDGKFRTISWDELNGGTMHHFDGFIQYKNDYTTYTLTPAISGRVLDLQTLKLPQNSNKDRTIYALVEQYIGSNIDRAESVKLFEIVDDKLIYPDIIKTTSGTTNRIDFSFDVGSMQHTNRNRYPLIKVDSTKNRIVFPVVVNSDIYQSGKVTNRDIKYEFKTDYFKKVAP